MSSDPSALDRADACAAAAALAEAENRWDEPAVRYEQAVELWGGLGYPGKLPHERLGLGRCLIHPVEPRKGQRGSARRVAVCEHLGAEARIAEIDELLASVD